MDMNDDLIDEVIRELDPQLIPSEYIFMAKITDIHGITKIVDGAELERLMKSPDGKNIVSARATFDSRKIKRALLAELNAIWHEVDELYFQKNKDI
jgi:hypothetical protein